MVMKLREVELYENERYIPISGWSNKNLLPTDRNSFSTVDGSSGWRTIQEASASDLFYQHGWLWETISEPSSSSQDKNTSNWTIDKTLTNIDIDGWAYSTDFSSYTDRDSGVAMKGMMHFVRRRRLIRKQFFNAYNLIRTMEPLTCDYCDLSEVERLSSLLLDRFVRASMVHHPRTFTIAKANKLKNDFVEALGLTSEGIVQYSYENTMSILDRFADAGKSSRSISSLTMSTTSVEDLYDKRLVDVARSGVLEKGECNDLAKICLQRFDPEFRFHCENVNCSQQTVNSKKGESESNESEVVLCPFRYEICPNEHCGAEYSAKWTQDHDSICPLKTVDCERVCGRAVLRKLMSHHMQDECMLRPVRCQYLKLGCEANLLYRDVKEHMTLCQSEHLELSVRRVFEQQSVIVDLVRRVGELEGTSSSQRTHIVALEGGLVAATAALKVSEARQAAHLQEQINRIDANLQRRVTDVEGKFYKETTSLHKAVRDSFKK